MTDYTKVDEFIYCIICTDDLKIFRQKEKENGNYAEE